MLVADQVFYESLFNSGSDVSDLERIEVEEGQLFLLPKIAEKLTRTIGRNYVFQPSTVSLWLEKVRIDSSRYEEFMRQFSPNSDRTRAELEQFVENVTRAVHLLDKGASPDDCAVLGTAMWIEENSSLSVSVVTDDRDLLGAGHVLASYFGINVTIRSIFEVLRRTGLTDCLKRYFTYCGFPNDPGLTVGRRMTSKALQEQTSELVKKAKLSLHPSLPRNGTIGSLLRQS